MRELLRKYVLIMGLGRTGSIVDEGLDVVAIERGPPSDGATDFPPNCDQDELRCRILHELLPKPDLTTFAFRDKMSQAALPIRSSAPPSSTNPTMMVAAGIDRDVCSRCRAINGEGVPDLLTALTISCSVRSDIPPSLMRIIPRRRQRAVRWRVATEGGVAACIRNSSGSSRPRFRPMRFAKHARRLHGGATDW
jgi:hypothetical protein